MLRLVVRAIDGVQVRVGHPRLRARVRAEVMVRVRVVVKSVVRGKLGQVPSRGAPGLAQCTLGPGLELG